MHSMIRVTLLSFSLLVVPCTRAAELGPMRGGNARVVFVGDSITGLGGGWVNTGFTFPMRAALQAVYPDCEPQLLALGGSGMGVGSWLGLARRDLIEERFLDVKGVGVKATLGEQADVLVIMLGMNDILAPYIGDTPAGLDQWGKQYRELVEALRERVHPKVIGLASITMQTDDPQSAKNQLLKAMNEHVRELADTLGCLYLPVGEAMWEVQKQGRMADPDYHTAYDLIHPNAIGQVAIAIGMLRGLGEDAAAKHLYENKLVPHFATLINDPPTLGYEVTCPKAALTDERLPFRIRYWWHGTGNAVPRVQLSAPDGWTVTPEQQPAASGVFEVVGPPDRLENVLVLDAATETEHTRQEIRIATPWLVTAGFVQTCWNGMDFQPEKARNDVDAAIEANENFLGLVSAATNPHAAWRRHIPTADYKGGANPGSVDFAAIVHGQNFEGGYGVRWIHSEQDRPVELQVFSKGLAARVYLTVWLNGAQTFADHLSGKPETVHADLKRGWNTLVFKSNHRTWEWQNTIELHPVGDDSLDDLRFTTVEPAP